VNFSQVRQIRDMETEDGVTKYCKKKETFSCTQCSI